MRWISKISKSKLTAGAKVVCFVTLALLAVLLASSLPQPAKATLQLPPAKAAIPPMDVASVVSATGTGNIQLTTAATTIGAFAAVAEATLPAIGKPDLVFPHGFISFTLNFPRQGPAPPIGGTDVVTITFPAAIPTVVQYWKCWPGPVWTNATPFIGHNNGDNILTQTCTDGGPIDADGVANGSYSDPAAAGFPTTMVFWPGGAPAPPGAPGGASPGGGPYQSSTARAIMPACFVLKNLNLAPAEACAGEPVTVSVNVSNTGDQTSSYKAELKINGQVEQTQTVSVGPHVAHPVYFTVAKYQPGEYVIDVGGQQSTFTVTGVESGKAGSTPSGALIIFILAGVVLVVGITVILLRRTA